jgi:hypothetical protein
MTQRLRSADIATLVTSEVAAAIAATDTGEFVVVTKLVVKVGEPAASFDDISWLAEITLDPRVIRQEAPGTRGYEVSKRRIPCQIAVLPASAISGVSTAWSEILASLDIVSLGDLARADQPTLTLLAMKTRTRRIFALAARARLCALSPLPTVADLNMTVSDAITLESSDLTRGLALDELGVVVLFDALSRLASALDAAVLDRMTLAWLTRED